MQAIFLSIPRWLLLLRAFARGTPSVVKIAFWDFFLDTQRCQMTGVDFPESSCFLSGHGRNLEGGLSKLQELVSESQRYKPPRQRCCHRDLENLAL